MPKACTGFSNPYFFGVKGRLWKLLLPILLAGCEQESGTTTSPGDSKVPVDVYTVELRMFSDETIAIGSLRSDESAEISASVTERLESLHFKDGEVVEEGQLLAKLASDEESAMLASAEAELENESREVERLSGLARANAVGTSTLDTRKTQERVAELRLGQVEAMMSERRIVAPFPGVIGLRRISPGALVEPGTVITTLDKIDTMKLDFTVPEVFLGSMEAGLEIQATTPAFEGEVFKGTIATIDSRVDPITRSLAVRALIPNAERRLRPGMLMTVDLRKNLRESPAVPERAIVPVRDVQAVFVVEDESVAKRVEVETGRRVPGFVEVISGLKAGQQIVSDGVLGLSDGQEVEIKGEFEGPVEAFDPTQVN